MSVSRNQSEGYNGYTKKVVKQKSSFVMPSGGMPYTLSNGIKGRYFGPKKDFWAHIGEQEKVQAKKMASKKYFGIFGA